MPWFPKSMVNLPHKEYWLSEQQAAKTYAVLSARMMWFAVGTVAFFIGLGHLVFQANLLPQPRLSDGMWWLLVGYLAFTTIWCAGLLVRFKAPSGGRMIFSGNRSRGGREGDRSMFSANVFVGKMP